MALKTFRAEFYKGRRISVLTAHSFWSISSGSLSESFFGYVNGWRLNLLSIWLIPCDWWLSLCCSPAHSVLRQLNFVCCDDRVFPFRLHFLRACINALFTVCVCLCVSVCNAMYQFVYFQIFHLIFGPDGDSTVNRIEFPINALTLEIATKSMRCETQKEKSRQIPNQSDNNWSIFYLACSH